MIVFLELIFLVKSVFYLREIKGRNLFYLIIFIDFVNDIFCKNKRCYKFSYLDYLEEYFKMCFKNFCLYLLKFFVLNL